RYLLCLTCGFAGLQTVWSVILSNGTTFLISLGLSKSTTALIWIAAPLAGTIIQPIVGAHSDHCKLSWGRRRPFIIGGALATACSIMALAWVEHLAGPFSGRFVGNFEHEESAKARVTILIASFLVCCLNISIQPVQVGLRALVIENSPPQQQAQSTAWTTYLIGIGNIGGYLAGSVDLVGDPTLGPVFQFRALALLASITLLVTAFITCFAVAEEVPMMRPVSKTSTNTVKISGEMLRNLPKGIRNVYKIQFFAWIGWFPILYYKSTYVSELYSESFNHQYAKSIDAQQHEAAHIGTSANLRFAMVALISNILFSIMLKSDTMRSRTRGLNLTHLWLFGHVLFIFIILLTFFVKTSVQGTFLLALAGIPWALTQWLPYVALGEEITFMSGIGIGEGDLRSHLKVEAGVVMSLHNAAMSLPQMLAAAMCSGIFWLAKDFEHSDATAWAIRISAVGTVIAAYLTSRLQ
ncbi:hypothetical protein K505DRAFT_191812, partial [Melanomma pulvis-pyrius CBS 109.77]